MTPVADSTAPAHVSHGFTAPGFEGVAKAFAEGQSADEGGAQLCVYKDGKPVVDVWTGRDKLNDRPYTDETITVLMSCTKGCLAACALILSERGLLDFDARVADYWPEFAHGGKGDITVRQIMSHSAGLMGFDPEMGMGPRELYDWDRSVASMEAMTPLWPAGSAYAYHFVTFGLLIGEVIRRITGKTVGRFFAEEVAAPLGLEIWIGLPEALEPRLAPHFQTAPAMTPEQWRGLFEKGGVDIDSRLMRTILHTFATTGDCIAMIAENRHMRAVELPAGNGIGNARSLAKMYAALIGDVDGVRLIRADTMEAGRAEQTVGISAPAELAAITAMGGRLGYGLGFELAAQSKPMLGPGSFGHSGAGGRLAYAYPERGVAVAYVCNAMVNSMGADPRWIGWTKALREALG